MFGIKIKKTSSFAKTLSLLLPFRPFEIDKFFANAFTGKEARLKWGQIFSIVGFLLVICLTISPSGFWDKQSFWIIWLMLFVAGLLLASGSLIHKGREKNNIDRRILFILGLIGFGVWVYQILKNGTGVIWPALIADELALFGFGFMASRHKLLIYGLILFLVSFMISSYYLVLS